MKIDINDVIKALKWIFVPGAEKNIVERRIKYLEPFLKRNLNILEVGCSSGFMLYPLIKKGINCTGISLDLKKLLR